MLAAVPYSFWFLVYVFLDGEPQFHIRYVQCALFSHGFAKQHLILIFAAGNFYQFLLIDLVRRQRERTPETCQVLYRSLNARLSNFPVKLVTIADHDELGIIIEVTRLSYDGLIYM